jgi:acyl-CoA reductase-like NAD-dependent aldehyde dehydrogenase
MNVSFIVDGTAVPAEGGATFDRKDPMTGKVATQAAAAALADVEKVVAAAAKAVEAWSETGPSVRRALLLKAADLMEGRTMISSD